MVKLSVIEAPSHQSSKAIAKMDKGTRRQLGVTTNDRVTIDGPSGQATARVLKIGREHVNQGKVVLSEKIMQQIGAGIGTVVEVQRQSTSSTQRATQPSSRRRKPKPDMGDVSTLWSGQKGGRVEPEDVVLVMDSSGSMSENSGLSSGISKIDAVKDAIDAFLDTKTGMAEGDFVSLVSFTSSAKTQQGLTDNYSKVRQSARSLNPHNGTRLEAGIREGYQVLDQGGSPQKRIIMLTDGHGGDPTSMIRRRKKGERGIRIDTVGVGSGVDENILKEIASLAAGKYVFISDMSELKREFRRISDDKGL